jgi:ABC-type dipeptide/oligopeptide/nickel transport system permease component
MKFLFQRILSSLLTLLVISFLTFSLLRFAQANVRIE